MRTTDAALEEYVRQTGGLVLPVAYGQFADEEARQSAIQPVGWVGHDPPKTPR